jgi:hypothetical protein
VIRGSGGSRTSGNNGRALLSLSKGTAENHWVANPAIALALGVSVYCAIEISGRTRITNATHKALVQLAQTTHSFHHVVPSH